jgi:hypothetical protein
MALKAASYASRCRERALVPSTSRPKLREPGITAVETPSSEQGGATHDRSEIEISLERTRVKPFATMSKRIKSRMSPDGFMDSLNGAAPELGWIPFRWDIKSPSQLHHRQVAFDGRLV